MLYAKDKPIVFKWAGFHPPGQAQMLYLYKIKEAVERRLPGQVKIEMYPGGSLVKGRDMLDALRSGLIDCALIVPGYFPAEMPLSYWGYIIPFGPTPETQNDIMDALFPLIDEECAASGQKLMGNLPFRLEWYFNKSIDLDKPDWSGLKLRPLGGLTKVMTQNLGAGSVSMSSTEAGVALSTKVIDGVLTSINTYYHVGLHKSAPYVFNTHATISISNPYSFSLARWKKLPKNVQDVLTEEFRRVKHEWYIDYAQKTDEELLKKAQDEGAVMMEPSPSQLKIWRKKMESTWKVLPEKVGAKGQKYLDIVKSYLKD
jgi:C4-dicarboxylate-binding protein DctP